MVKFSFVKKKIYYWHFLKEVKGLHTKILVSLQKH